MRVYNDRKVTKKKDKSLVIASIFCQEGGGLPRKNERDQKITLQFVSWKSGGPKTHGKRQVALFCYCCLCGGGGKKEKDAAPTT